VFAYLGKRVERLRFTGLLFDFVLALLLFLRVLFFGEFILSNSHRETLRSLMEELEGSLLGDESLAM